MGWPVRGPPGRSLGPASGRARRGRRERVVGPVPATARTAGRVRWRDGGAADAGGRGRAGAARRGPGRPVVAPAGTAHVGAAPRAATARGACGRVRKGAGVSGHPPAPQAPTSGSVRPGGRRSPRRCSPGRRARSRVRRRVGDARAGAATGRGCRGPPRPGERETPRRPPCVEAFGGGRPAPGGAVVPDRWRECLDCGRHGRAVLSSFLRVVCPRGTRKRRREPGIPRPLPTVGRSS